MTVVQHMIARNQHHRLSWKRLASPCGYPTALVDVPGQFTMSAMAVATESGLNGENSTCKRKEQGASSAHHWRNQPVTGLRGRVCSGLYRALANGVCPTRCTRAERIRPLRTPMGFLLITTPGEPPRASAFTGEKNTLVPNVQDTSPGKGQRLRLSMRTDRVGSARALTVFGFKDIQVLSLRSCQHSSYMAKSVRSGRSTTAC